MRFRFHPFENKKIVWPIILLVLVASLFYRDYRQKQEMKFLESLLTADRIILSHGDRDVEVADPEGFIKTFGIPANITRALKGAKFGDGSVFDMKFYRGETWLGTFLYMPITHKDTEVVDCWENRLYAAKARGKYYCFSKKDNNIFEFLQEELESLGLTP